MRWVINALKKKETKKSKKRKVVEKILKSRVENISSALIPSKLHGNNTGVSVDVNFWSVDTLREKSDVTKSLFEYGQTNCLVGWTTIWLMQQRNLIEPNLLVDRTNIWSAQHRYSVRNVEQICSPISKQGSSWINCILLSVYVYHRLFTYTRVQVHTVIVAALRCTPVA